MALFNKKKGEVPEDEDTATQDAAKPQESGQGAAEAQPVSNSTADAPSVEAAKAGKGKRGASARSALPKSFPEKK